MRLFISKHIKKSAIVFVVLLLAVLLIYSSKLIKIDNIVCTSQFGECSKQIDERLSKNNDIPLKEAKEYVNLELANDVIVEDFNMQYQFPDVLKVNIIESTPLFAIKATNQDVVALVSEQGIVMEIDNSTNLPVLLLDHSPPNVAEKVNEKELFALNFLYDVYPNGNVARAMIIKDNLEIELEDGIKIIVPLEGDREVLVGSYLLIKSQLNSFEQDSRIGDSNKIKEIDLRYKNPVLR